MVGVAGEAAGDHDGAGQRRLDRRCFGAAFEHPPDQPDVDHFVVQGAGAGRVDPVGTPLLDEPQQGVDLAHLRPWQRDVQQCCGVDADRCAVAGGHPPQPVQVAHRVDGLGGRQVGGIGGTAAGSLAGMDLDQLATLEDAHQRPVGAHLDTGADEVARHRVERLGHLDVMIPMHLRRGVDRHVVAPGRRRRQAWQFLGLEHLDRAALGGAVDPLPGPPAAPLLGASLGVGEIDERLAGEERVAHERHRAFHPRLVLRAAHPRRIDPEPSRLGVLDERLVQPRRERVGVIDDRGQVVGDHRARRCRRRTPTPPRTRRSPPPSSAGTSTTRSSAASSRR